MAGPHHANQPPTPKVGGWHLDLSNRRAYRLTQALSVLVLLAVWEWAGRRAGSNLSFPPFSGVMVALGHQLVSAEFWRSAWTTLQALILGFCLTVAVGIPVGLLVGRSETVKSLVQPYISFFLSAPHSPLVPVYVIIFHVGLAARVATVVTFGIAILIVNTAAGVQSVPKRLVEMARSFGATEGQIFRRVIFPASLPGIIAGLRLTAGRNVVGMVVAELVIVSVGLGKLIGRYSARFDAPNLFAIVLVVLAIGVGVVRGVGLLERRLIRWK